MGGQKAKPTDKKNEPTASARRYNLRSQGNVETKPTAVQAKKRALPQSGVSPKKRRIQPKKCAVENDQTEESDYTSNSSSPASSDRSSSTGSSRSSNRGRSRSSSRRRNDSSTYNRLIKEIYNDIQETKNILCVLTDNDESFNCVVEKVVKSASSDRSSSAGSSRSSNRGRNRSSSRRNDSGNYNRLIKEIYDDIQETKNLLCVLTDTDESFNRVMEKVVKKSARTLSLSIRKTDDKLRNVEEQKLLAYTDRNHDEVVPWDGLGESNLTTDQATACKVNVEEYNLCSGSENLFERCQSVASLLALDGELEENAPSDVDMYDIDY